MDPESMGSDELPNCKKTNKKDKANFKHFFVIPGYAHIITYANLQNNRKLREPNSITE